MGTTSGQPPARALPIRVRRPHRWARRWAAAALVVLVAAGAPARADDITDEGAQDLERQVREWLADLLGPRVDLGDRPVEIAAEDDHFRVTVPIDDVSGAAGVTVVGEPITAVAKPLDGGRWAIDQIVFPSPVRVTYPMARGTTTTVTVTADEQTHSAVLDPSFATTSSWDGTMKGYATRSEGPQGTQTTRLEKLVSHSTWQPAPGGHVNMLQEIDGSLLTVNSMAPQVGLVAFSAARMHLTAHMDNVAPDRVPPIVHAVFDLAPLAAAAAAEAAKDGKPGMAHHEAPKMTPQARAALRRAVLAVSGLASGFGEQMTLNNVHVDAAGRGGHLGRFVAGMGVAAPDGKLTMRMNFVLDGLESPDIPPGVMRDYLPRHIAFSPRIGGVVGKDLTDLLLRAIDSDGDDPALQAKAEAMMQKGPIAVGLDDLALDFGPVALTGGGAVQILDRGTYSGEAHFAATGIDEMIRRANTTPELQQAVPVLILLKGIGQQDGDKLVWNITYQDRKLLVNGNDLSQMVPGK